MEKAHHYARTKLGKNVNCQKKYYDIKSSGKTFDRGDFVWLFCPRKKVGISPKLQRLSNTGIQEIKIQSCTF